MATKTKLTFTERVKTITDESGITISQIAQKAGLPYQTVWRAVNGHNYPRRGTRALIALALNLPTDHFEVT